MVEGRHIEDRRKEGRNTKEYKGSTDSNSPVGPNEAVRSTTHYSYTVAYFSKAMLVLVKTNTEVRQVFISLFRFKVGIY